MSGSTVDTINITADKVITEELKLSDTSATGISSDYNDASILLLSTAKALNDVYRLLTNRINTIDNDSSVYTDTSCLTPSIMSDSMEDRQTNPTNGYDILGFVADGVYRIYTGTGTDDENYIKVPTDNISAEGRYIFIVEIGELPTNGYLECIDNDGNTFGTIGLMGKHVLEATVTNVSMAELSLVAHNIGAGQSMRIDSIKFHRVTDRLYQYLLYRFNKMLEDFNDSGFLTAAEVQAALNELDDNIRTDLSAMITTVSDGLAAHKAASNPHSITADSIYAARKVHTHTPAQCGAAPEEHTHTPDECGAAAINHTHTPESIGAADRIHTHDQYVLRSEVLSPKQVKPSIIVDAPIGFVPEVYDYTKVNLPVCSILSNRLTHEADGFFDMTSGMITANRETSDAKSLYKAVHASDCTVFEEETTGTYSPCMINYQLQTKRSMSGIIVRKCSDAPAYATQLGIYINNELNRNVDLVWNGMDEIEVLFPVTLTDVERVSLRINAISEQDNWSFGFDFMFTETGSSDFAIAAGVVCAYEGSDSVELSSEIITPIPFSIGDMVNDHPYFVGLMPMNGNSIAISTDIPPQYGVVNRGVAPFLNRYDNGPTDDFYGTISATSAHVNYPIENVYMEELDSFRTEVDVNSVTIEHNFEQYRDVFDIALLFSKEELEYIPTNITIRATVSDGTTLTLKELTGYIPDINNDNADYVTIRFSIDKTVSALMLDLSGAEANEIRMGLLKISLSSQFYNVNRLQWDSGELRKYIGIIYRRAHGGYDIRPYPTGDTVCLPVNDFNAAVPGTVYEVVNPFGSTNLDVNLECIDRTNNLIQPIASVVSIEPDKIRIKTDTADVFAVSCFRGW